MSSLLNRDWSKFSTNKFSLAINRRLTRRNNRLRTSIYKRLKKRKSDERKNSVKLRRKKRSISSCFCKEKKETYKLKTLLSELIIIITSLFNLLVVTFTICC